MTQLRATAETAHGDYLFRLCLAREGFKAILGTLYFWDRQMMMVVVVVVGTRPRCLCCKQFGHLAKVYPQRTADSVQRPRETEINNTKNSNNTTCSTDTTKDTVKDTNTKTAMNGCRSLGEGGRKKEEEPPKTPALKESIQTKYSTSREEWTVEKVRPRNILKHQSSSPCWKKSPSQEQVLHQQAHSYLIPPQTHPTYHPTPSRNHQSSPLLLRLSLLSFNLILNTQSVLGLSLKTGCNAAQQKKH